jgi:hypothetical protein
MAKPFSYQRPYERSMSGALRSYRFRHFSDTQPENRILEPNGGVTERSNVAALKATAGDLPCAGKRARTTCKSQ